MTMNWAHILDRRLEIENRQWHTIRCDTIRKMRLTWTKKLSDQLNLSKKETKTNKSQCPFHTVQVKAVRKNTNEYGGKAFWKRWVLSLEWKIEGVIDGKTVRAKVVTVMRSYAQDEVNQEDSEQNEVDGMKKRADSTGKVIHIYKRADDDL